MSGASARLMALVAAILWLAASRLIELSISSRHLRGLAARGAREFGGAHYPFMVALHAAFPLALCAEVVMLNARLSPAWPLWLALWLAAQGLRAASIAALGEYWTARVVMVSGQPRIRRGPYRWLAHPSYVAVAVELAALPLMFGAWRTAIVFSAINAVVLAVRLRDEREAWSAIGGEGSGRIERPANR